MSLLAGPYGHPLHPIAVTIPLGTWAASFAFDIASRFADDPGAFARGAYWLIALGILGAAVAAMVGLLDLFAIPSGTKAFRAGLMHMALNLLVIGLFTVSFVVRRGGSDTAGAVSGGLIALSAVTLGILGIAGWLGGTLSFRFGVRVADESAQTEGFLKSKGLG